jgi:hypothetical protein
MIETMEQFLAAVRNDPHANASLVSAHGEINFDDIPGLENQGFDSGLMQRLTNLGILYIYSGMLKVNPMAIRVLDRMHAEGKAQSEDAFYAEILESKDLYSIEHQDFPSEIENSSF